MCVCVCACVGVCVCVCVCVGVCVCVCVCERVCSAVSSVVDMLQCCVLYGVSVSYRTGMSVLRLVPGHSRPQSTQSLQQPTKEEE